MAGCTRLDGWKSGSTHLVLLEVKEAFVSLLQKANDIPQHGFHSAPTSLAAPGFSANPARQQLRALWAWRTVSTTHSAR
jgi:hypothetical protein